MEDISKGLSESNRQTLKAFAPLLAITLLILFVGRFAINQIISIRDQINNTKKTQSILISKLKPLESVSESATVGANIALSALPSSNPSLQVVTQLKILASQNQLVLNNIKSSLGSSDTAGTPFLNTTFNLSGPKEQITMFIKGVESFAPITFVEKFSLAESAGASTATVTVRTYFVSLPTKIPTITQPITELTTLEKELLSQLSRLTSTVFVEVTQVTNGEVNENPFGQ